MEKVVWFEAFSFRFFFGRNRGRCRFSVSAIESEIKSETLVKFLAIANFAEM